MRDIVRGVIMKKDCKAMQEFVYGAIVIAAFAIVVLVSTAGILIIDWFNKGN